MRSGFTALTVSPATARSMICSRSCSSIAASAAISLGLSSEVPAMRCKASSPSVFASAASWRDRARRAACALGLPFS
jgi:hypothetical protein